MKIDVLNARKKIFEYFKAKASSYEGKSSKELKLYRKDQTTYAERPFAPSTEVELLNSVLNSDVVYIGDYHTFEQNVRGVLRIMRKLHQGDVPYILAVEMIDAKFQNVIDAYHTGFLTDLEFLDAVTYHESWRFPWTHYKLLFDEARKHLSNIYGLNTSGNLIARDKFAAKKIDELMQKYPQHKIIVFYGEYHICENKIPKLLEDRLHKKVPATIIHQNLDEVYWKLIEDSDKQKIVKFNDHEFCINASPPWIKYDSMVYWYENLSEDPEFDIHEYIIEKGIKIFGEDAQDNFFQVVSEMTSTLKISLDEDALQDVNIYDYTSIDYVEEKILEFGTKPLIKFFYSLLHTGQSFRLPNGPYFYCSSYSMNRLSYLAGIHIYHAINSTNLDPEVIFSKSDTCTKFSYFCFEHMYAYFFSKIINPHRKCDMYIDIKNKIDLVTKSEKDVLNRVLEILDGKCPNDSLKGMRLKSLYDISLYVGHILGEYLYSDLIESPFYNDQGIEDFLKVLPSTENFRSVREKILNNKEYQSHIKRFF